MVREENTLNILLQFVPGGSIRSLRGRLLSFLEAVSITYSACTVTLMSWPVKSIFWFSLFLYQVIRKYAKQLLYGREYLHHNGIIHRDIKARKFCLLYKLCPQMLLMMWLILSYSRVQMYLLITKVALIVCYLFWVWWLALISVVNGLSNFSLKVFSILFIAS